MSGVCEAIQFIFVKVKEVHNFVFYEGSLPYCNFLNQTIVMGRSNAFSVILLFFSSKPLNITF